MNAVRGPGERSALGDITLALPAGRMVGLIGPDGVGKSTLMGLVAGAKRLQQGRVQTLGGDMADARHRAAVGGRIAYMPQGLGRNLYHDLSLRENLEFFGKLFKLGRAERAARIETLTRATGLYPFLDRLAGKLSGGMKQKLGLCSALIHDPDFLLLDEPTTGVDPLSRRQFWDLIDAIRADRPGMSVLVSTAYMEEAARFDHLVAMNAGRVLAEASPGTLMSQTATASVGEAYVALLQSRGPARLLGTFWPTTWYMAVSVGSFTKGLGLADLSGALLRLAAFGPVFTGLAILALRKQERLLGSTSSG